MKLYLIITLTFISISGFAQSDYKLYSTTNQVELLYKWKHAKLFDDDSPLELRIQLNNQNDSAVMVSFTADFYLNGVLKETNSIENYCINAKQTAKGKMNGIVLQTEILKNEDIESEAFSLKFNDIKVVKTLSCEDSE